MCVGLLQREFLHATFVHSFIHTSLGVLYVSEAGVAGAAMSKTDRVLVLMELSIVRNGQKDKCSKTGHVLYN